MKPTAPDSILLACWPTQDPLTETLDLDPTLMEIAGKPMLLRAVERLVSLGYRDILVVLGDRVEACRTLLGSGERWSCRIRYCFAGEGARPLQVLDPYLPRNGGDCMIATADTITISEPKFQAAHATCFVRDGTLYWSGWARVPRQRARALLLPAQDREDLDRRVLGDSSLRRDWVGGPISTRTCDLALEAVSRVLAGPAGPAGILRKPLREGVWVGSACRVHPDAKLIAPVYIGNHAWIGKGAVIGPDVIVGDGCVIDQASSVRSSLVLQGTYIGKGIEVDRALVCGNQIANVRLAAVVRVPDKELLGGIIPDAVRQLDARWIERAMSVFLWLILWPIARALTRKMKLVASNEGATIGSFDRRSGMLNAMLVRFQPTHHAIYKGAPQGWIEHFAQTFHPGLLDVAKGRVSLVGLEPRTRLELAGLPAYWKSLYRKAMTGLVNEALVLGPEAGSLEMRYAGDALASSRQSVAQTTALLRRYLGRIAGELLKPQTSRLRGRFSRGVEHEFPAASGRP